MLALRSEGVEPLVFDVPRGQGLACARNAALAATTADVLAFVDDDVAVEPGWLAALQEAWDSAPDDCGFIGGPIGVRFTGPRPPWLTDALLAVLGVADGQGRSFHGGNVSFRTEALRGIEGFWPARGRPELHDWFSEEHYAQHELTAAGWSHASAPGAAAARIVDPSRLRRRDLFKCRARYGARSALIGERRPRATAARIAASSAAGAAVAAVRRDSLRATERAARAAENAAALVAPLIAHRELQPTATQTPFRHSVPAPQPLADRQARCAARTTGPVVLLYHRVDERPGLGDAGELRRADRHPAQPVHAGAAGGHRERRGRGGRLRGHLRRRLRRDHAPRAARARRAPACPRRSSSRPTTWRRSAASGGTRSAGCCAAAAIGRCG